MIRRLWLPIGSLAFMAVLAGCDISGGAGSPAPTPRCASQMEPASPAVAPDRYAGFPPTGEDPSAPATGTLVLSLEEGDAASTRSHLSVFADGRVVWQRWDRPPDVVVVPEGALAENTGYVEQRLTPDGVRLLRSEILATGLFEHDQAIAGRIGDRWVHVQAAPLSPRSVGSTLAEAIPAQLEALAHVEDLLADPAAWLPATAWATCEIRAFVPARYWVFWDGASYLDLPAPTRDLLRRHRNAFAHGCGIVPTGVARAIHRVLVHAGMTPLAHQAFGMDFELVPHRHLWFTPALPDPLGEARFEGWRGCGRSARTLLR